MKVLRNDRGGFRAIAKRFSVTRVDRVVPETTGRPLPKGTRQVFEGMNSGLAIITVL